MKVRLKTNLILGGKHIPFDSILDDSEIPVNLRTEAYVAYDLEHRDDGKVLVLHDIAFQSVPSAGSDGIPVSYPVHIAAGETLKLDRVPPAHRASLREGTDFLSKWNLEQQKQLLQAEEDSYLKQFETQTAIPR